MSRAPLPAATEQGPGAISPRGCCSEATSGCCAPKRGQQEGRIPTSPSLYSLRGSCPNKTKQTEVHSGEQVGLHGKGDQASNVDLQRVRPGRGQAAHLHFPFSFLFPSASGASSRDSSAWAHPDPPLPKPTQTDTGERKQKARVGGAPFDLIWKAGL